MLWMLYYIIRKECYQHRTSSTQGWANRHEQREIEQCVHLFHILPGSTHTDRPHQSEAAQIYQQIPVHLDGWFEKEGTETGWLRPEEEIQPLPPLDFGQHVGDLLEQRVTGREAIGGVNADVKIYLDSPPSCRDP